MNSEFDLSNFKPIGDFQKKNLMMAIKACEILGLKKKNFKMFRQTQERKGQIRISKRIPDKSKFL